MAYAIADIEADLVDYLDFEEVGSVERAKKAVTAANRWLLLRPNTASSQASSLSLNTPQVEGMRDRAQAYVAANSTSTAAQRTRFFSMEDFRS